MQYNTDIYESIGVVFYGCSHNCESCSSNCGAPKSLQVAPNKLSTIRKVIGVVSGKGGVGKSLVTSMLAVAMTRRGYHSAILDADITGPSIPKAFGMSGELEGCDEGIYPKTSATGIDMISINFLLPHADDSGRLPRPHHRRNRQAVLV